MVGNGAIDLYWGRNSRVWWFRSLLGTMLKRMTLYISTGDGMVGYGAVYLYLKTGLGYKRPHRYTCAILSLTAEGLTSIL